MSFIYLDNAATTYPKPDSVYRYMDEFYRNFGFNVSRGQYSQSNTAVGIVSETRQLIGELFSLPNNKRVVFTPSATEAINVVLQGLDYSCEQNIYITHFEHNAVLRCLNYIDDRYKINKYFLFTDKRGLVYDLDRIQVQFQSYRPNIVIMTHASNAFGCITPIKEICDLAKEHGATTIVDCAQTAGLLDIDLSEIKADYVIFAGHKTLYGSFGVAGFVCDKDSSLKPLIYGGTGVESANPELPDSIPEKFEVGSLNIQAIAGLNAALKWIKEMGQAGIYEKEQKLTRMLLECLSEFDNIKVFKAEKQVGIVSCTFDGYSSDSIGQILADRDIAVRRGLHCAPDGHRFLGTFPGGTVRFSLGYFNSESDIAELKKVLQYIVNNS